MKHFYFIAAFLLFSGGVFSANAQDLIILRDGNIIEAKITEMSQTEIKYKRFNHLDGPVIVIAKTDVHSIRYENKTVEIINPNSAAQQQIPQPNTPVPARSNESTVLQQVWNRMPAIPIAGNNLKFEFRGETWIARVNGENFSAGTIKQKETGEGAILTLKQTHIWPGAVGKTAGRVANVIPGGGAVGGVLNTAGSIAGLAGAVEMSGTEIVLEYKAGPPASLKLISNSNKNNTANTSAASNQSEYSANARNNWMSYGIAGGPYYGLGSTGDVSVGITYERMLNSKISLGLNAEFLILTLSLDISTFFRVYPRGKTTFLGVGFGYYHGFDGSLYDGYITGNGFSITPEIGWKIDVGNVGGFFIVHSITCPLIFQTDKFVFSLSYNFGMGHAF